MFTLHSVQVPELYGFGPSGLAFSGDGKTVAAHTPQLHLTYRWDVASGKELSLPEAPVDPVHRMAFSADGKRIIAAYAGRMVSPGSIRQDFVIWDMAGAKPTEYSQQFGAKQRTHFLANENLISPNRFHEVGKDYYPTCSPGGLTIPVVFVGKEKRREGPHKDDPRQRTNYFHGMEIGLWNVREEKMVRSFEIDVDWSSERARAKDDQGLRNLVLSPDRTLLAGWTASNSVFVWDLTKGVEVRRWNFPDGRCNGLAFSRDGKALISSGLRTRIVPVEGATKDTFHTNIFHVIDLASGKERVRTECVIDDYVACGPVFASLDFHSTTVA